MVEQPNLTSQQSAERMEIDKETLVKEGQEFIAMQDKHKRSPNPDAGQPCFLISVRWLEAYQEYVHYGALKMRRTPEQEPDHCKLNHPGHITNIDFLEIDTVTYLQGSSKQSQFESSVYDRFLKDKSQESIHYEVFPEDIWQWLKSKYDCDHEVKRFYVKPPNMWYTRAELNLTQVPVAFYDGSNRQQSEPLQVKYVQIRPTHNYGDLKKRLVDVVNVHHKPNPAIMQQDDQQPIKSEQLRMWRCQNIEVVQEKLKEISESNGQPAEQPDGDGCDREDVEINSGFDAPGSTLEGYVGSTMNFESENFKSNDGNTKEVFLIEIGIQNFTFRYQKPERVFINDCEFCRGRKALPVICECKRVRYCSQRCLEQDKRFHLPSCAARLESEMKIVSGKQAGAKEGLVGLTNLGNTCYMNSSIQCLSNAYELTQFMLEGRYQFMNQLEVTNVLGTEGRLTMAYAKTINEMWNSNSQVVRPDLFKKMLGQYASQFEGYGQHDSHECINTMLDLMGEDLFRKGKKPFVEDKDPPAGQSEEDQAKEAWNKHLLRNESIVTDLFHGQYKSTLNCLKCGRTSVTFDPFMTLLLPIPAPKEKIQMFYIPYHIKQDYKNNLVSAAVRGTDSLSNLRQQLKEVYGLKPANYIITRVANNEVKRMYNCGTTIDHFKPANGQGMALVYEIMPEIAKGEFPQGGQQQLNKWDSNNGVEAEYTPIVLNLASFEKKMMSYGYTRMNNSKTKKTSLPRILWTKKSATLKDLHLQVFQFMRGVISEWVDWKDPKSERDPHPKCDLAKDLIDFPYRPPGWSQNSTSEDLKPFTRKDFDALSDEQAFNMCMPGLVSPPPIEGDGQAPDQEDFTLDQMPYILQFQNISAIYEECKYCGQTRCSGCPVPYNLQYEHNQSTVKEILANLNLEENNTFYSEDFQVQGKQLGLQLIWHESIDLNLFYYLQSSKKMETLEEQQQNQSQEESKSGMNTASQTQRSSNSDQIRVQDCLADFKQTDILDEENMWYCNICKDHVQAQKTMSLFRMPKLLILTLKRFKQQRQVMRYGFSSFGMGGGSYGGGGGKLDTFVDFPLDGLDMSPFVMSQGKPLIYDCFAVSNHFGNVGFGHYTAFAKNPLDGKWYNFDDSNCKQVFNTDQIVSNSAYSIFYRLREEPPQTQTKVDFDALEQRPDMDLIAQVQSRK